MTDLPLALYLHFPYCLYKCHYCDFNSYPVANLEGLETQYLQALLQELRLSVAFFPRFKIKSIFLGGGTPSLFSAASIGTLLNEIQKLCVLDEACETTLEANPKTIDLAKVKDFLHAGVNRFSLGIQSFQDRYLKPLGRLHSGQEAYEAAQIFEKAGATNYNLDLMFGFPRQTLREVESDVKTALSLNPTHLSFYNLTVEPNTLFAHQFERGEIHIPDNELQAEMYQLGVQLLTSSGYDDYEISNFSKINFSCQHNLAYWHYNDYLGIGAGAVSFLKQSFFNEDRGDFYGYRWTNPKTPKEYVETSVQPFLQRNREPIDLETALKEYWMMGLRLKSGVFKSDFLSRFPEHHWQVALGRFKKYEKQGWVTRSETHIQLTAQGRLFINDILLDFF